jgi:AcrR family transcriptional regulator
LEVAADLYAERGYEATPLNEIIRATGLTKGAVYFHFDSREHLAFEVYRREQEGWMDHVSAAVAGEGSALERLVEVGRSLAALIESRPRARCVGKIGEALASHPELGSQVMAQLDAWIGLSEDLLRQAQEGGEVPTDLDTRLAAEVVVASFIGMEHVAEMRGGGLARHVEGFVDLLLRAFGGRG